MLQKLVTQQPLEGQLLLVLKPADQLSLTHGPWELLLVLKPANQLSPTYGPWDLLTVSY
jgi:hypothetical protein